jgi:hypothetical protein
MPPSLATHPQKQPQPQKQSLVVYTEDLTQPIRRRLSARQLKADAFTAKKTWSKARLLMFDLAQDRITHLSIVLRTFPEKFCSMVIATTKLS